MRRLPFSTYQYSISGSAATTRPVTPVSSLTSRTAVCSEVSPSSMCPLGSCQRLPCWVEINRIVAPRTTRPPAERWCSASTIAGVAAVAGVVAGGAGGRAAVATPRARFRALSVGGLFAIPAARSPGGESCRIDSHRLEGRRPDPVGVEREDQVAARGGCEPVVAQNLLDELSRAPPGIAQEEAEALGRRLGEARQVADVLGEGDPGQALAGGLPLEAPAGLGIRRRRRRRRRCRGPGPRTKQHGAEIRLHRAAEVGHHVLSPLPVELHPFEDLVHLDP